MKCLKQALVESCTIMLGVYSAGAGRWISRDPMGEGAGMNLYGYVGNNPIDGIVPLGDYYSVVNNGTSTANGKTVTNATISVPLTYPQGADHKQQPT